jgi:hypothetical protein
MNQYLREHYAWGPRLPNAFECAKSRLVDVEIKLLVEPEIHPEGWNKAWGKQGDNREYMLDVSATAYFDRKDVTTHDYLGGSWDTTDDPDKWIADNCHGYLPQMTQQALLNLSKELPLSQSQLIIGVERAITALEWLMDAIYSEQQRLYSFCTKSEEGYYLAPAA